MQWNIENIVMIGIKRLEIVTNVDKISYVNRRNNK